MVIIGGRGAYWSGQSGNFIARQFDAIDKIGNIKVIQPRAGVEHLNFPLYSNTRNTTYYVTDSKGERITTIGFYRNHELAKSIDITSKGIHQHSWINGAYTKRGVKTPTRVKEKGERPITSARDRRLIEGALEWKKDG